MTRVKLFALKFQLYLDQASANNAIRTVSANSVDSDLGCTSRIYFDNVTLTLHNVTLTSQKPCLHNNKCDSAKQIAINEVYSTD